VGIYHHLMYSMPTFVRTYDEAVQSAPNPALHALQLHLAIAAYHLAVFSSVALFVPTAMELQPALSGGLGLPSSGGAAFGLLGMALIGTPVVGLVTTLIKGPEEQMY
ncbi:MAG: hypothetical protein SGPRY_010934, partial [Prymnesium sp.]